MTTYNRGDFYPRTGDEINSSGNVVNEADGVNSDGSKNVVEVGSKVIGPTLIDTIPYSSFTASTTLSKMYKTVLNRNAKMRTFHISNGLNQPIASGVNIYISESTIQNGGVVSMDGGSAYTYSSGVMASGTLFTFSSSANGALAANGDTVQFNLPMGATAPTSGNVYVYVTEVL